MKELSVEQKAKRYDELIAKLIKAKEDDMLNDERYCCVIDEIVPELKESEDEKIRKALIEMVHDTTGDELWVDYDIHKEEALAWLEEKDIFSKKDIDDAYLKGIRDAKNEIEKQYEADYQIRKDIANFIFNYNGDIKDRAKWMNYLGIKVSFVEEQGERKHKFNIGDVITNGRVTYRVDNIVKRMKYESTRNIIR